MSAAVSTFTPREKGIIFSGESVRAILDGRKTQTRRIIKPQPDVTEERLRADGTWHDDFTLDQHVDAAFQAGFVPVTPPCDIGDVLWVRETFRLDDLELPIYAADGVPSLGRWTSPIYMPRACSRVVLRVESLRVERLHSISEADCLAEGVRRTQVPTFFDGPGSSWVYEAGDERFATARTAFAFGWDRLNGKRAPWSASFWLWVIGFSRRSP